MTRPALRHAATAPAPVHGPRARTASRRGPLGVATDGRAPLAGVLLAALAAAGCDNPACVFSPAQCQNTGGPGGPGGLGSFSAVFPNDVSYIAPTAPSVVRSAPAILDAHTETPLIVEFDQSLDPASLSGAFELIDSVLFTPVS
jgi:hypothetical protein